MAEKSPVFRQPSSAEPPVDPPLWVVVLAVIATTILIWIFGYLVGSVR